jgi:hypothetical protein
MQIAKFINKIMINEGKKNIHLLGKCNGAWVLLNLLSIDKDNRYKALYLGVPGVPYAIDKLGKLSDDKLKNIKFLFWWHNNDAYKFTWEDSNGRIVSKNEINRYTDMINKIQKDKGIKMNFKIEMYKPNGVEDDEGKYHDVHDDMIDHIIEINS